MEITICKDGVVQEKQTLSSANNWTYQWTATGSTWSVLERQVPEGYAVTVQRSGSSFFVTNTRSSTPIPAPTPVPGNRPKTGDDMNVGLYAALMAASGLALLLGGVSRKRSHEE